MFGIEIHCFTYQNCWEKNCQNEHKKYMNFVVVEYHFGVTRLSQLILPFNFSLIPYNFIHDYNNLFRIFINLQGVEFIKNNNPCWDSIWAISFWVFLHSLLVPATNIDRLEYLEFFDLVFDSNKLFHIRYNLHNPKSIKWVLKPAYSNKIAWFSLLSWSK